MRGLMLGLAILMLIQFHATAGHAAPSFDCHRAHSAAERAICADPALAAADVRMSDAYRVLASSLNGEDRTDLAGAQRAWLATLSACREPSLTDCLSLNFDARTDALSAAAKGGAQGLAILLWTDAVLCDGDRFLIRFASEDNQEPTPPPSLGGRLARAASAPVRTCRLADGRRVRLALASAQDGAPWGTCGADGSQLYSLWIGGRKVVNRQERRGKCDAPAIRALYYNGRRLIGCSTTGSPSSPLERAIPPTCERIVPGHVSHPSDDNHPGLDERAFYTLPLGAFAVTWAAPGMADFCHGLIHRSPEAVGQTQAAGGFVSDLSWPRLTVAPRHPLSVESGRRVDLDNSHRRRPAYALQLDELAVHAWGRFYLQAPPGQDARAQAAAGQTQALLNSEKGLDLKAWRRSGLTVMAGDQPPYGDMCYAQLTPFRQAGATWFVATAMGPLPQAPIAVVTRPRPDGGQSLVCRYQATPGI